ncbi:hypothetical protein J2S54_001308 [Streptomyces sp. DSM 42143]|nr:hypothetical protein [Streptomyces sp. DSM 42143]
MSVHGVSTGSFSLLFAAPKRAVEEPVRSWSESSR